MIGRIAIFLYGVVAYLAFLATFLYAIGFVAGAGVPKTIDSGAAAPLGEALLVDLLLLGLFAVQHSGMARPGFKRWWTRIVPQPMERSTYVLLSSLVLMLLFWQWRPLPSMVWSVENGVGRALLWGLQGLGWLTVLVSTFMISHFHLFGLKQVGDHAQRREPGAPRFQTPGLYRHLRHPIMLGFLIAFWATPAMSLGHLLFAVATTGYILIALQLEERDLVGFFGDRYRAYREQVPMLLPRLGRTAERREPGPAAE
jgi:methanethiol S-methyltransferase